MVGRRRLGDHVGSDRMSASASSQWASQATNPALEKVNGIPMRGDSSTTREAAFPEPVSRDRTPPELYRETNLSKRQLSSRKGLPPPRTDMPAIPRHRSSQRASTPYPKLKDLPQALRIHPKLFSSGKNTDVHAERQRISSRYLPPPPSLHPSLHQALRYTPPLDSPAETPLIDHSHAVLGTDTTATMPDASLTLLDFWTDPSPSDTPGPHFWSEPPVTPTLAYPAHNDRAPARAPSVTIPPAWPRSAFPISPTTKQILQSFSLTRTPTPRRRTTRSWSVASLRPSPHYHAESIMPQMRSVIDRPARGFISRKPVPEGGLRFLRGLRDGERLASLVSINTRPEKVGLARGHGRDEDETFMDVREGRPGTA